MDTKRMPRAGDPFTSAPDHDDHDQERLHIYINGLVYIGHRVIGEDGGEEVGVFMRRMK